MIPFAGPSNLLIPTWFPNLLVNADVGTVLTVGILVALGAALAKGIHYIVTFFISKHLSEKRQARLQADAEKVKRWAFPLLFIAAASPIPDEPIVIPLGLMRYNPIKFFVAYFSGKLAIAVAGAFLGNIIETAVASWLSFELTVIFSVVLTVIITIILLKIDVDEIIQKIFHRKKGKKEVNKEN